VRAAWWWLELQDGDWYEIFDDENTGREYGRDGWHEVDTKFIDT
jgi:hypothetical protein